MNEPKNIEKSCVIMKMKKVEEDPFGDSKNMRLLSSIRVKLNG